MDAIKNTICSDKKKTKIKMSTLELINSGKGKLLWVKVEQLLVLKVQSE